MKKYDITGMSCAACSKRVEKAIRQVSGVDEVNVNLLTNSMMVSGDFLNESIIKAVEEAGYGASLSNGEKKEKAKEENIKDNSKYRLLFSCIFLVVLMYFSMFHTMWGFPLFSFIENNPVSNGLIQLLLCSVIMVINQKFFINGFKGLIHRSPNMDTLVALGSGASFVYSVYALFKMSDFVLSGEITHAQHYRHELYFESAAMILTLITVGKMLEAYSKGKTTNALKSLKELSPKKAVILKNQKEITVDVEAIKKGDIFILRPGMKVPADGVVVEGESSVDEASLTGESVPVDKKKGDKVYCATVNQSGFVKCEAVKTGEETVFSKIIKTVEDASGEKAPAQRIADKVSGVFVPFVMTVAVITTLSWLFLGKTAGFSLSMGICVLVVSCPCALGLATPVAIMVGNGVGAKNKILFKTATALEECGKVKTVVLDKTGTVTEGKMTVSDIAEFNGFSKEELLKTAYSLEIKSEHPISEAIVKKAKEMNIEENGADNFTAYHGSGVGGIKDEKEIFGGNFNFIKEKAHISDDIYKTAQSLSDDGKTVLYFTSDGEIMGIIAVSDVIRSDSKEAVGHLKKAGIRVVMLTGDNKRVADYIAKEAGIDEVIAEVLPHEKKNVIEKLKESGKVLMVGDGINDAPALTRADTGIAIGAGADIAVDSADIVLTRSSLFDVVNAIILSRATLKNIKENLFWAFCYNIIGIPLAAGVWYSAYNLKLNPMFAAAAMSFSSFFVVTNSLRLNLVKLKKQNIKEEKEEKETMEKVLKIEGMMCPHCEGRVKKALEEIKGVKSVEVSHEKGTAVVVSDVEIDEKILTEAVENQGYKVL